MKFSVLLPTRNRLEYLKYAVETVLKQDYQDWEVIVSDNHSTEDILGYVAGLGDPRVRAVRTDDFIPVTENWNNALNHCTGDYVIMLGDDDGLLPNYFSRIVSLMRDFPDPDFVYTSAVFFAYPGVMPSEPEGFLRRDRNGVFDEKEPFWLDRERATGITRGYLDFRMPVASNMQFSLISRRMLDELTVDGEFFKSPYPDFYATPALFLKSEKILVVPEPMVIIGITPKSYGFFHFNNRSDHGVDFLNNNAQLDAGSDVEDIRLPGTSYNDSWLLAMEMLRKNFSQAAGMLPDHRRYRQLQIIHCIKKRYFDRALGQAQIENLKQRLSISERLWAITMGVGFSVLRLMPTGLRDLIIARLRALVGQHAISQQSLSDRKHQNLGEVFVTFQQTPLR